MVPAGDGVSQADDAAVGRVGQPTWDGVGWGGGVGEREEGDSSWELCEFFTRWHRVHGFDDECLEGVFERGFDVGSVLSIGFDKFGEWANDSRESFTTILDFEDSADGFIESDASLDHLVERRVTRFEAHALFVEGVDAFGEIAS